MRHFAIASAALAMGACSQQAPEERMFVRIGEAQVKGDPSQLFLRDALARLNPDEKELYSSKSGGFLFSGEDLTCIVVVTFRTDIINDGPSPAFCYDKDTNKFVKRL